MRRVISRAAAVGVFVALTGVYLAATDDFGWPSWTLWASIGAAVACLTIALWFGGTQAIADFDEATLVTTVGTVESLAIDSFGAPVGLNVRVSDDTLGRFKTVVTDTAEFPIRNIKPGTRVTVEMWSHVKRSAWITRVIS